MRMEINLPKSKKPNLMAIMCLELVIVYRLKIKRFYALSYMVKEQLNLYYSE